MIINCTECGTRYIVAPQAIGKDGRLVKCSKCAHTWFEEPPEEDLEIVPEQVIVGEQDSNTKTEEDMKSKPEKKDPVMEKKDPQGLEIRRNVPAVIKEKPHGITIGWIVLVVFLLGLIFSLYYFRQPLEDEYTVAKVLYQKWDFLVMGKNPPAQPVPLPIVETKAHPASFLAIRQSAEVRFIEGLPSLALALEITNTGRNDVELPILTGIINNAEEVEVFTWAMKLNPSLIPAGGFQQFNINVDNIPADSATAEVFFDWN
ncbi:MAG: zinc-ribbon domain-containing protein [Proteobacteria bacterium]|nr:zinc-ribbon domain-containing protein [Pseudomonadota bacterium]